MNSGSGSAYWTSLVPVVKTLCEAARDNGLELTIDAEEADRLELSLEVFERVAGDPDLLSFNSLGMVVQAYSKRAIPVLEWLIALARESGRRIPVRLVKGAYWDAEIKHARYTATPAFRYIRASRRQICLTWFARD